MIIQLNPTIPMKCPKGNGHAIALLDYSQEHDLVWVIALDDNGEIWSYRNPDVRMLNNVTIGREYVNQIAEKQHRPVEHHQQEPATTSAKIYGTKIHTDPWETEPHQICHGKLTEDG